MLPFLSRYWKPLAGTLLVVILLGGAYKMGYDKAELRAEAYLSDLLKANAEDHARQIAELRGRELVLQQKLAEADRMGTENVEKIRSGYQATIDELTSGNRKLRSRLAAVEIPSRTSSTPPTPGLGGSGSVETVGLRVDDAAFLIRRSDDSDIRAEALKTCVRYYNNARESVQNGAYLNPNK